MNKYILTAIVWLAFGIAIQNAKADITFPIRELGNCADKTACKTFCDTAVNFQVCTEFAEKNDLLPKEAVQRAKKFVTMLKTGGPGNCRTERTCRTYCEDVAHVKECVSFAKKSGIVEGEEAARLEKISTLKEKDLPGDCTSIKTCRAYCANPENKSECLGFAEDAGYLPRDEVRKAKQMLSETIENTSTDVRRQLSSEIKRCMEQIVGKEEAARRIVGDDEVRLDRELEVAIKRCLERLRSNDEPQTTPGVPAGRPRFSALIMRCIEQSVGKSAAEKINAGALQLDSKLEMAIKECVRKAEAAKPSISPVRKILPSDEKPLISTIPPELMNGGATNLPAPEARLQKSIRRHFYLGSLLRALFSF